MKPASPRARRPDARGTPGDSPAARGADLLARCERLGFAAAGLARPAPSAWDAQVRAWLEAGSHGEMAYLTEDLATRLDPRRILPGVRAFLMVLDLYAPRGHADAPRAGAGSRTPASESPRGRVARYARGRDYHRVIKVRLHALADQLRVDYPGSEYRSFVDTAPILERELASLAGLGWHAKNTMLIHPRLGSWFVLGGLATTLDAAPEATGTPTPDHCGTCTRCIDACPTGAITPYRVEATRCVSYLTIEHRSEIPPALHAGVGDWLYGCDVCQEVCPHNSARDRGPATGAGPDPGGPSGGQSRASLPVLEVLGWTGAAREEAIRASSMKRATLAMMKRNAAVVLGNAARAAAPGPARDAMLARLRMAADDPAEHELVRRTAAVVLSRFGAGAGR